MHLDELMLNTFTTKLLKPSKEHVIPCELHIDQYLVDIEGETIVALGSRTPTP